MTNKKEIVPIKEEIEDNVVKYEPLFSSIDYKDLVIVKGREGIFITLGIPNKGNMIGIRRWDDIVTFRTKTLFVRADTISPLENFQFHTTNEVLHISEVFDNLYAYESKLTDDIGVEDFNLKDENTMLNLMDIAVPNYDTTMFKSYHLKKVIKMYKWVKSTLDLITRYREEVLKTEEENEEDK